MHQKCSIPGHEIKKFLGGGTAPCPLLRPLGRGHPLPKTHPLGSGQIMGERGGSAPDATTPQTRRYATL